MSTKNKILIGLLAATVTVGALSACGSADRDAALIKADDGDIITYGYGNMVAKYNQALYDQIYVSYFGSNVWGQDVGNGLTFEEDVKEDILEDLEEEYLAVKHASDYGVSVTDEEEAAITAAIEDFFASNTDKAIKQLGADEEDLKEFLRRQTIRAKVKEAIRAEVSVDEEDAGDAEETADTEETAETDGEETTDETDDTEVDVDPREEHYEEVLEGWKADTTWEVDEDLWNTIKFDKLFSLSE